MPYITINNFKFGLDGRRSELSSAPGSLITAQDGHITQGGEFEQRMAFVNLGTLPADVFGFEATAAGLVVFGSAASSVVNPNLPANVTYIQCAHPTDSTIAMTGVLCSCCFGGNAFCAAQFGQQVFLYLNGTVVPASIAGQVLTIGGTVQSIEQIVQALYNQLNTEVWQSAGITVSNLTATGFYLATGEGVTWQPAIDLTGTTKGQITSSLVSTGNPGVAGTSASAQVTVYAADSGTISGLTCQNGSTTYKLIGSSAANFTTDINGTAAALATLINAQIANSNGLFASGSTPASSSTNTVTIKETGVPALASTNYLNVAVTGNICLEDMALDFSGVTASSISNIWLTNGVNLISGLTYPSGGTIQGNPTGHPPGNPNVPFTIPFGTYLWIPGANETKMVAQGTTYQASDYPNGVNFTYSSGIVEVYGKTKQPVTAKIMELTDLLSNTSYTLSTPPTAAQVKAIATAITATAFGFVASNTTTSGGNGLKLYISRKAFNTAPNSYTNLFFYVNVAGIAQG